LLDPKVALKAYRPTLIWGKYGNSKLLR
jgi:hypothetical protein